MSNFNSTRNFFTEEKDGLSSSDAQAISNLCNQKAQSIDAKLKSYNNYYKAIDYETVNGGTSKPAGTIMVTKVGNKPPAPGIIKDMIFKKASYHALQAYLMEHIKLKDSMLELIRYKINYGFSPKTTEELGLDSVIKMSEDPEFLELGLFKDITAEEEQAILNKITRIETLEYLRNDAYAAHLGQYFHKDGHLDKLRAELPKLPEFEFIEFPDGRSAIVNIVKHNTTDELDEIHMLLADEHRKYERKVNAVKGKTLDITTELKSAELLRKQQYNDKYEVIKRRITDHNNIVTTALNAANQELRTKYLVQANEELVRVGKLKIIKHESFSDIFAEFLTTKEGK